MGVLRHSDARASPAATAGDLGELGASSVSVMVVAREQCQLARNKRRWCKWCPPHGLNGDEAGWFV